MAAAVEAISGPQNFINEHNKKFLKRRDLVLNKLNDIDGITCQKPEGAFYVYPNCEGIIGKKTPNGKHISNDEDFMTYLLEDQGVAEFMAQHLVCLLILDYLMQLAMQF